VRRLIALLLFFVQPAAAATIDIVPQQGSASALILVQGLLRLEDIEDFQFKVANVSRAVVVLDSDGGNLLAGIRIGTIIRLRNFVTLVPGGALCASSCGFAWLGGARRFMAADARIGFHAAYRNEGGQPIETGAGNALLGAYLSQIGLSELAIVYVTQAPPRGMTWLTIPEATRHQIDVNLFTPEPATTSPTPRAIPPPQDFLGSIGELERRTRTFVASLHAAWSAPTFNAQLSLGQVYADQVLYYGKDTQRSAIIDDKNKFVSRWPQRKYDLRESSLSVRCTDQSICTAAGIVDWATFNPTTMARARGTAQFQYAVEWSTTGPRITMEAGSVTDREKPLASIPGTGAGWWTVLASFSVGDGSSRAVDTDSDVKRTIGTAYLCGFSAFNDYSSRFAGFTPGYMIVVIGPHSQKSEAERVQQQVSACAPGAYIKFANRRGK
jgi:hypothetical protein